MKGTEILLGLLIAFLAVCGKKTSYSAGLNSSNSTETDEYNESGRYSNIPETIPDTTQSTTDKPQSKLNQDSSSFSAVGILFVCFGIVASGIVVVGLLHSICREKIQRLVKRACVISRPDATAAKKSPEGAPFLDNSIDGRATNDHNANLTETNCKRRGKTIKEVNKEKVEMHAGKNIIYNRYEIHYHHQPKPDTQQEQKLTENQETNEYSDGHPEPAMQYYSSN